MTARGKQSQAGFSAIEIIIVIVIVAVITALAKAPMDQYIQTVKQKSALGEIKRMLQTARSRAMSKPGVHCGAYFDLTAHPQRVILFNDTFSPETYAFDADKDKPYLAPYVLPNGITLSIAQMYQPSIVFRGDGSAYLSVKVVMKSTNFTDTLDVLASTGRIRASR